MSPRPEIVTAREVALCTKGGKCGVMMLFDADPLNDSRPSARCYSEDCGRPPTEPIDKRDTALTRDAVFHCPHKGNCDAMRHLVPLGAPEKYSCKSDNCPLTNRLSRLQDSPHNDTSRGPDGETGRQGRT